MVSGSMDVSCNEGNTQQTTKSRQVIASLSAAGGAFAVGAALGWPSPAISRFIPPQYFSLSKSQSDLVASIITLGTLVSCLPVGGLMRKFGRKNTMLSLVVPFTIGWALVIWPQNYIMLIIGRFLLGLAGGAFCVSIKVNQKCSIKIKVNFVRSQHHNTHLK
jgi:predicted MFS family arabinose efflux permease